jgi:hypothetical protein
MSDRLARFIEDEVFPAVIANAEIKAAYPKLAFTKNPWGAGVMGCSSGGAAALSMDGFVRIYSAASWPTRARLWISRMTTRLRKRSFRSARGSIIQA